jgi:prepilin peptidase CpaA
MIMEFLVQILLTTVLLIAAAYDLRYRKIPNFVNLTAILTGLACHTVSNGIDGLLFSLGGLFAGLGLLLLPYLLGGMGAGDVKLMAAVGAFTGAFGVFYSFIYSALIGALYAVAVVICKRGSFKGFWQQQYQNVLVFAMTRQFIPPSAADAKNQPRLSYGVAIALGTGVYLFKGLYS